MRFFCAGHGQRLRTLEQRVGDDAHLAVGAFLPFEGGVELIHGHHERAGVLLLNLHIGCLYSEKDMRESETTSHTDEHAAQATVFPQEADSLVHSLSLQLLLTAHTAPHYPECFTEAFPVTRTVSHQLQVLKQRPPFRPQH